MFTNTIVEPVVGVPEDRGDIVCSRGHSRALKIDDPGNTAGCDHDVLALEVSMDHSLGIGVNLLREAMKFLLQRRPVLQHDLLESRNKPIEKIACFPSQIVITKDPVPEQGTFMDMPGDPAVEHDQDIEHASIDVLDMSVVMGKLQV